MTATLPQTADRRLAAWVDRLEVTGWSSLVLDRNDVLVWISPAFKGFLHELDDERVGVGKHIVEAIASPVWLSTVTPDSIMNIVQTGLGYFIDTLPPDTAERVDEPIRSMLGTVAPMPRPDVWNGKFGYYPEPGRSPITVQFLVAHLRDDRGERAGTIMLSQLGIRPALLALLAQGDEAMYERMAELVQPGRHQAAILFSDLQGSGELSRRMATPRYFSLVRSLTEQFDAAVAANSGIVGKHAGDGWTAFFLVSHCGSPAAAAAAALNAARSMREAVSQHEHAEAAIGLHLRLNVGLHWGSNLYIGQLVPGGRLETTALGDEVNECARIQETARDGALLASKAFLELFSSTEGQAAGVDVEGVTYEPLGGIAGVSEKAQRDAATLAVCRL